MWYHLKKLVIIFVRFLSQYPKVGDLKHLAVTWYLKDPEVAIAHIAMHKYFTNSILAVRVPSASPWLPMAIAGGSAGYQIGFPTAHRMQRLRFQMLSAIWQSTDL